MSGVLSIPFGLAALFSEGHPRTYFALLAFAALLIASAGLVKRILELKERLRPKLKLHCETSIPGCVVPNSCQGGVNLFYRLAVSSDCESILENCQGRLIEIRRALESVPIWSGDTAILTFAPGEKPDSESKTIHPHVTVHLDVLMVLLGPVGNFIGLFPGTRDRQWRLVPPLADIFNAHGQYILTIEIVGDHMPTITRELEFTWRGHLASEVRLL